MGAQAKRLSDVKVKAAKPGAIHTLGKPTQQGVRHLGAHSWKAWGGA